MKDVKVRKFNADYPDRQGGAGWPAWARVLISAAIAVHGLAIATAALSFPPSSSLEQAISRFFVPYYQTIDQGYAYHYYAPEPGATPVVTARVHFKDGRPDAQVRLPERGTKPRLRYQRQLALAQQLYTDFDSSRMMSDGASRGRWARSYARHLGRVYPGARSVTIYAQMHLIPDLPRVRESLAGPRSRRIDIDSEEFYTTPEWIGDYPCDAS